MMDFLRDPLWTFIACCVGGIGIFIPMAVTLLMSRKRLICEIITNSTIVEVAADVKERLQVTIDGRSVSDARLISLKFTNTGFLPIKISDFAEDIEVVFSQPSEILQANIIDVNPGSLNPTLEFNENTVTIKPIMLNRNDFFVVKVLIKANQPDLSIRDRIVGIKNIKLIDSHDNSENAYIGARIWGTLGVGCCGGMATLAILGLLIFVLTMTTSSNTFKAIYAVFVAAMILFFVVLVAGFTYYTYKSFKN